MFCDERTMKKEIVIKVQNLGKKYQLGKKEEYLTLRDSLVKAAKWPYKLARGQLWLKKPEFWALKNVSFEVKKGEVMGIIGKNGAGKTTLLKILSRITEPTTGKVTLKGRVASLLEVGTGFHPELTGRENIYLNGAILGMKRKEIEEKFEEVVEFSGIKKFLETPVKRYSSGMYVRLAFAIAAHLEPEILLVDEVLAVGDAEFQKKCLGKMKEVAAGGRTVLFVSHNLGAIESLCKKAMVIEKGRLIFMGERRKAVGRYLNLSQRGAELSLDKRADRTGVGFFKIVDIEVDVENNPGCGYWQTGNDCLVRFQYKADLSRVKSIGFGFSFVDRNGKTLFYANTLVSKKRIKLKKDKGVITCQIKNLPIYPGQYYLTYDAYDGNILLDRLENACLISVENGDFYGTGMLWGEYSTLLVKYDFY